MKGEDVRELWGEFILIERWEVVENGGNRRKGKDRKYHKKEFGEVYE